MGTEPGDVNAQGGRSMHVADYCRAIESYLCQKNDGHLIRVVGPAFELVSGWAADAIPLKVAFEGINRYFERYYRRGPRRRPVRIDHCAADVLDVFDEWRRATGIHLSRASEQVEDAASAERNGGGGVARHITAEDESDAETRRGPSLAAHLERVMLRLSSARATDSVGVEIDPLIDRLSRDLDAARSSSRGLRGDARRALIERLADADRELMQAAHRALDEAGRRAIASEADQELEGFRDRMAPDQFARAHRAVADRLLRQRLGLPIVAFS